MKQSVKLRKKHRKVCVGDMVDRIILHTREIQAPALGNVKFTEKFTPKTTVWAAINTVSGKTIFDGTNEERDVTHEILIRYVEGLTSEDWVELLNGDLLDILPSEDLENRNEFMLLKCSIRGQKTKGANQL